MRNVMSWLVVRDTTAKGSVTGRDPEITEE